MIDKEILDKVIPVPELETLREQKIAELKNEGFVVTNFHSGGIFYTVLMIVLRIQIELLELARTVLNQMFVSHASGVWLDLKMEDYSKTRKKAQKAQGFITITRKEPNGEAVKIPKGHIFKTAKDVNGEELRFFALESITLPRDIGILEVMVEAEKEGSRYNVPAEQITRTLTYIGDVSISNSKDWLTRAGSDTEDDESARTRVLRSWSELAMVPLRDTYVNVCEAISGVLYVIVNDQHPRGQGTVDVIVTSEVGVANNDLLERCKIACKSIQEPDTDILVKSAVVVTPAITLNITVSNAVSQEGVAERVKTSINDLLKLRNRQRLNELTHADIIHQIKSDIPLIRNVIVAEPVEDLKYDIGTVILPGSITVFVEGI